MTKLPLIWLRRKLSSKPEGGLNWPKPHTELMAHLCSLDQCLSNFHTCQSPRELVRTWTAGLRPPSLWFSTSVVGPQKCAFIKSSQVMLRLLVQAPRFENHCHWEIEPCWKALRQEGRRLNTPSLLLPYDLLPGLPAKSEHNQNQGAKDSCLLELRAAQRRAPVTQFPPFAPSLGRLRRVLIISLCSQTPDVSAPLLGSLNPSHIQPLCESLMTHWSWILFSIRIQRATPPDLRQLLQWWYFQKLTKANLPLPRVTSIKCRSNIR